MKPADPKAQKAQLDVLVGAGKEMANNLLRNAHQSAENPQQLAAQVFATQICGCHILALCAFNQEKQAGIDGDTWLDNIVKEIKIDLENIRLASERGEIVFSPIQKTKENKAES